MDKIEALNTVTRLAMEVLITDRYNQRVATEHEAMAVPIFEKHMMEISPNTYNYEPSLNFIFEKRHGSWYINRGLFFLWFKKNTWTFSKLTNVPESFRRTVRAYENMNTYLHKVAEEREKMGALETTEAIVDRLNTLWGEYKSEQLSLFNE